MATHLVTTDDLQVLKEDLLNEFDRILKEWQPDLGGKWLKTHEVIRFLRVSPSTVQAMRNKGTLPYTKIGNVIYYDAADVHKMLDQKTGPRSKRPKTFHENRKRL